MTSRFKQDQYEEARAARVADQTEAFKRFLSQKHPEIRVCVALFKEIEEYMQDSFLTAGDEDFEYAIQNINVSGLKQHVPTSAEVREDLVEQICEKFRSPKGDGAGGRYSDDNLKSLRLQMKYWSIDQLKAKLESVTSKQEQAKLTVPELKKIVQDAQPKRRADGYPTLPKFLVPEGQVQAIRCDSAYLLNLARVDYYSYKKLVSRFGSEQITERQRS
jgi:hypothetical protein